MRQYQHLYAHAATTGIILKSMSNERRLRILCHLADGERSVGELEALVGLSQSALSQHLARLRRGGLVTTRRSAQTVYYDLNGETATAVMAALDSLSAGIRSADSGNRMAPATSREESPANDEKHAVPQGGR